MNFGFSIIPTLRRNSLHLVAHLYKVPTNVKLFQLNSNMTKLYSSTSNTPKPNEDLNHKKIRVLDVDINYVETEGNGSHVVVCLPGAFSSIELDFQPLIKQFDTDKFKVVVWDPPGYGRSRPPNSRPFGPDLLDKDSIYLTELMNKLGHKKYSVLAWSAGAVSGTLMAVRNHLSVKKLVIWGSSGYIDEFTQNNLKQLRTVGIASMPERRRKDLLNLYGEEGLNEMWKSWTGSASADQFSKVGFVENGDFTTKILNEIKCQSLIIHGLKDGFVSVEQAHYLHKNIPNSRLYLMPNGHHNLHVTCVQEFTGIVEEFLLQAQD